MGLKVFDLGLRDFDQAWQFQKEVFLKVKTGELASSLIVCSHNPVITLGRFSCKDNILATRQSLEERAISVYEIERGGNVTYHGPGQLTVYPVFDLRNFKKDIHWFLRSLEQVVIDLLGSYGINGSRVEGKTGVWHNGRKLASIGITVRNWITYHGLSLNVKKDDLENFKLIKPCGMDIEMTSIESVLGRDVELEDIKTALIGKFKGGLA